MTMAQLYSPETLQLTITGLLADSWAVKLVRALSQNRMRFSALQHDLGISSKTLSARLKELEKEGLISRTLYAQVPLRVEYELTDKGYEFNELLDQIGKWEKKWKN